VAKCENGDCAVSCPGSCACVVVGGNPANCYCSCDPEPVITKDSPEGLTLEAEVSIDCKGVPLIAFARAVESRFPGLTAIPSDSVYSQVTMQVENMRFAELLQVIGLVILERPETYTE
jgi:hypothetical protein